ncbi:hypothetical protein D4R75_00555 [bacterium]|nr:MAG: hypothetical protein D4R75_00555 [bacterium]
MCSVTSGLSTSVQRKALRKMSVVLIIGACLAFAPKAQAQIELSVGVAVGTNYSIHSGSALPKTATGLGLIIGGQAEMSFTRSLGIVTTISYDNRIGYYSDNGSDLGIDFTEDVLLSASYISIEPMFKYVFPNRLFYVVSGPCLGIAVQGRSETTTNIVTPGYSFPTGYATQTVKGTLENMNSRFEWKVGAGYGYQIDKTTRLNFQLTYGHGLTKVAKDLDWKVNSLTLLGSFEFALGR